MWFKKLFKRKKEDKRVQIGDVWRVSHNPFDDRIVTVLEIKDGYVKYRHREFGPCDSCKISVFARVFESKLDKE